MKAAILLGLIGSVQLLHLDINDSLNPNENLQELRSENFTGNAKYSTGLLKPPGAMQYDNESEEYFDMFRHSRQNVPASYSAVDAGLVTPVKNQQQCGSCVAFATASVVETCFKKLTNTFGDYSEQQFVDCAYGTQGAFGCSGAYINVYFSWGTQRELVPASESQYPYLNTQPKLTCPSTMPSHNIGAKMRSGTTYYTYSGDEETLKKLVYSKGAVLATVQASGPFQYYSGGVFSGCSGAVQTDHAITVVGYGTDNGKDYWLIKNSWGTRWGENGYIRLERGVNMCGIGKEFAIADCAPSDGDSVTTTTTSSTTTTATTTRTVTPSPSPTPSPSCSDQYINCASYFSYCKTWSIMVTGCRRTCGYC